MKNLKDVVKIEKLNKSFGVKNVLHNINLTIKQGQFIALVGPSGCGKSTLLYQILGTLKPTSGVISIDGKAVKGPNRDVGIVYQKYSLYDFMTARANVAFGPMLDQTSLPFRLFKFWKWKKLSEQHNQEAEILLRKLKLADAAFDKYPSDLSGGMQQRVAVAQSLIMKPKVILFDEPFSALDEETREEAQIMLREMYQENVEAVKEGKEPPYTVVIVTHELNEACIVADRIVGLSQHWTKGEGFGRDLGATKVYDKPAPVLHPEDPKDLQIFFDMKNEIREVVLSRKKDNNPHEHVTFWKDVRDGKGTGIAKKD